MSLDKGEFFLGRGKITIFFFFRGRKSQKGKESMDTSEVFPCCSWQPPFDKENQPEVKAHT